MDADWSLGVSASSSELQAIGSTFVVLRLHTERTDGSAQYVHLGKKRRAPFLFPRPAIRKRAPLTLRVAPPSAELTLPRFYELRHQLEAAKAQLELS